MDFVNSYGRVYTRIVQRCNINLARFQEDGKKSSKTFKSSSDEEQDGTTSSSPLAQNVQKLPTEGSEENLLPNPDRAKTEPKMFKDAEEFGTATSGVISRPRPRTLKSSKVPKEESKKTLQSHKIFVSDSEVSLLEVDVHSPDFMYNILDANIPKQERLSILSPKAPICDQSCDDICKQNKAPDAQEKFLIPSPQQNPSEQREGASTEASTKRMNTIEHACQCGCGSRKLVEPDQEKKRTKLDSLRQKKSYGTRGGQSRKMLNMSSKGRQLERSKVVPVVSHHPAEIQEWRMRIFYTQCFPFASRRTAVSP